VSFIEEVNGFYWGVSVGGDGLLSKAGIVSGLFTEEFEKELEEELTGTSPKNENDILIYRDSNEPRKNTDQDLMNLYVEQLSELCK
tara:strand:+ start:854 stop:1111 length:258 start_codon:yes stop_codon:yes gene_type:complete